MPERPLLLRRRIAIRFIREGHDIRRRVDVMAVLDTGLFDEGALGERASRELCALPFRLRQNEIVRFVKLPEKTRRRIARGGAGFLPMRGYRRGHAKQSTKDEK